MKKILLFGVLLLLASLVFSQDKIIRTNNQTIDCKIFSISNDNLSIELVKNGNFIKTVIKQTEVVQIVLGRGSIVEISNDLTETNKQKIEYPKEIEFQVFKNDSLTNDKKSKYQISQDNFLNGVLIKNARIRSLNGNTLKSDVYREGDSITIFIQGRGLKTEYKECLHKIDKIEVVSRTKYSKWIRLAVSIGVGTTSTILTTYLVEQPKSGTLEWVNEEPEEIPWYCESIDYYGDWTRNETYHNGTLTYSKTTFVGEYSYNLDPGAQTLLFMGSALTTFLIGTAIKRWEPVYQHSLANHKTDGKFDFDLGYNPFFNNMNFKLSYKF